MNNIKKILKNNAFIIVLVSCLLIVGYFFTLYFLNDKTLKENEYGDFIGGVLNPFLTLLSTLAIIFLTVIIANGESKKSDESIKTQKRLTLNQMRHEALNNLMDKLNMYVYELDNIHVVNDKQSKFVQQFIAQRHKENRKDNGKHPNVWLIMLLELESFSHKNYLFESLFNEQEYTDSYEQLSNIISLLVDEHNSEESVKLATLSSYIVVQQKYYQIIGAYILKEF